MRHEWTEARRAFPGSEVTPSELVAWAADQAGLVNGRRIVDEINEICPEEG